VASVGTSTCNNTCDNLKGGKFSVPADSEGIGTRVEVPAKAGTGAYEVSEGVGEDTNGGAGSEEEGAEGSIRRSGMRADVIPLVGAASAKS
jgi:hypothetical protein